MTATYVQSLEAIIIIFSTTILSKRKICFKAAKNNAFKFICCYLPPASGSTDNDRECMLSLIENITAALSNKLPNFVLWDFNCRRINWQNPPVLGESVEDIFSHFMLEHGFLQVVDEPTSNKFIIDWIFVNNSTLLTNVHCTKNFSTSDHCNIIFALFIPFE